MARLLEEDEAHIGAWPRADMGVACERPHGPLVCAVMLHGPPPVRGQAWRRILAALPLLPVTKFFECQPNMQRRSSKPITLDGLPAHKSSSLRHALAFWG